MYGYILCLQKSSSLVVDQLLTVMDGFDKRKQVFIMAASNRPDIIDPAILRPGRLDKVVFVDLPCPADRCDILRTLTKVSCPVTCVSHVQPRVRFCFLFTAILSHLLNALHDSIINKFVHIASHRMGPCLHWRQMLI